MDTLSTDRFWVDEVFPRREIEVGGQRIAYREAGAADLPVIACLHGIGSGSGSWVHQAKALSDNYRIIAWDAPGYSNSTSLLMDTPGAADYGAALGVFFGALNVSPAALVGNSLGAVMAGAYVTHVDAKVKALVLVDPANGYGSAEEAVRAEKLQGRLSMIRDLGPAGMAETRSAVVLSANASPEALEMVKWSMAQTTLRGYEQASRMLAGADLMADLAGYDGPVIVMCGSEDQVTPEEGCRQIAAACRNSEYLTLPGVGHVSYVEGPDQFNQHLLAFLRTVDV